MSFRLLHYRCVSRFPSFAHKGDIWVCGLKVQGGSAEVGELRDPRAGIVQEDKQHAVSSVLGRIGAEGRQDG